MSFNGHEMLKPKSLHPGARVAVVSPASTPKENSVRAGMAALESIGYQPVLFPSVLCRGPLYYAGTIEQRVADLHAAFSDPSIDAIFCTRGGWGSAELLPYLDPALVRVNPKPFVGYSDHTSLHIWFAKECGLISFYGPMVAADFSRDNGADLASWEHALTADAQWSVGGNEGLRVLQEGTAEGTLFGGCLSIVTEALGTPYALPVAWSDEPRILFLEDIGTNPYKWDRFLLHMRYAGMFENVTGIVFGDMRQCVEPKEDALLEAAIRHALRYFRGPIGIGLRCGHVDAPNVTLPFGVRARFDAQASDESRLHFLEPATR